ncbi:MAG: 30S ribosomal protein S6 [bacterium]|nr:30S ribosomal protein S6 [bacterium]
MRLYETTFIVNPQSDDAAIDRQVSAVSELIKNNEGEIVKEDRIGTRRLAYSLAGLTQGFYASVIFKAPTSVLPILERHYKLEEPYIRYLTIKYERDLKELEEPKDTAPVAEVKKPSDKPADKPAEKTAEKPAAPEAPETEAKKEPEAAAEETAPKTAETPAEKPAPEEPKTPGSEEEL